MTFRNKLIAVWLLLCCLSGLRAQERPSIHQQEWQAHRHLPKAASLFDSCGTDILPLSISKRTLPAKAVFGYLPDWEYELSGNQLQYDVLTHIGAFDFHAAADGDLGNPSFWPWTDVINKAHENGAKVILVVTNFKNNEIHNLLTNGAAKSNLFSQLKNRIMTYKLDGVNIDFEGLYTADRGALLNGFMAELTDYMHTQVPGSEVSFAGPAVNWGGWDLAGLANACDYIFIMGYAFYGKWSSASGPQAPLTGGSYNISNTVNVQYKAVTQNHPEKLILGLPYYGGRWQTVSGQPYASVNDFKNSPRFRTAAHESANFGPIWDSRSQTPWYAYQIGADWYQVWCDNRTSLALKYDLAQEKNYRGVGMWALGYDNGRSELWNELRSRFVPGSLPVPDKVTALSILPAGHEAVRISMAAQEFGDGFRVYYGKAAADLNDSLYSAENICLLANLQTDSLYYIRVKAQNGRAAGPASEPLAAIPTDKQADVLIVHGFERNNGNSNQAEIISRHVRAFQELGYQTALARNGAVIKGDVDLQDYAYCDWLLGEESSTDFTFNVYEKQIARDYLAAGGRLFVSGSEIGWDLIAKESSPDDNAFYENYLKAIYVADAPLNKKSTYYKAEALSGGIFAGVSPFSFDNGSHGTYNVDWPDAIRANDGGRLCLKYSGVSPENGGCAVSYAGTFPGGAVPAKMLYLSFPFETIYPQTARLEVLERIMDFFNQPVNIDESRRQRLSFRLRQNYPNPFNGKTLIPYRLEQAGRVELSVYNARGQKVRTLVKGRQAAGSYAIRFDAGSLASGLYYYKINTAGFSQLRKMILLK